MNFKKILSKKWWFNNWPFVFIFVFFLYLNFLSPLVGDDWEIVDWFSINASGNFLVLLKAIIWTWKNSNGRGLSNFLMSYFCYYKILWNFVSAGMFLTIIYLFSKLFEYKNKISLITSILLILSLSNGIREETWSVICANIAFMVPITAILFFVYKNKIEINTLKKIKKTKIIASISLCLFISTLMENISAGFTLTLGLINTYILFKNKRIDYFFVTLFIFSLLGSIFMFTSPGMHNFREVYNESLGFLGTFKSSLFQNINLTILDNNFVFFAITLTTIIAFITNSISTKKIIKHLYLIYLFLIILILLFSIFSKYLHNYLFFNQIQSILLTNNFIVSIFWLLFLILFLIPIISLNKNKNIFIFIYLIAIFSFIPASLITQTAPRIISITVIFFIGIGCGILNEIQFKSIEIQKIIYGLMMFGIFVQANRLSVIYRNIHETQLVREKIIENSFILQQQGLWDFKKELVLPKYDNLYPTANPDQNGFHYLPFLNYFKLDPKTKVVFE